MIFLNKLKMNLVDIRPLPRATSIKQSDHTIRRLVSCFIVLFFSSVAPFLKADTQTPEELISSMSEALRTLNYEGTFVHSQGYNLTTMHILHANDIRGEFERLSALDGELREVFRSSSLVTCIWPDSQSVVISKSKSRELLPVVDASLIESDQYSFEHNNPDRVAGRDTLVVSVTPKDNYRYGYRFWIDTETNMLLRSMLLDGPSTPVEQIVFTHIDFPEEIDISRFDILNFTDRGDSVSWLQAQSEAALANMNSEQSALQALYNNASSAGNKSIVSSNSDTESRVVSTDVVQFAVLPAGYSKVSETLSPMQTDQGPVRHVMLTDGMASVSVYIEYMSASAANESAFAVGLSRMGAMNAFGRSTSNMQITAVGEVPEATVRSIAAAVILNE